MNDERIEEASSLLAAALGQVGALRVDGARSLHRRRLERVLALSEGPTGVAWARIRARAQAARAEDARHGAGQLSRSAQRAPTCEDCEEGWRNVSAIVEVAVGAAADAARLAGNSKDSVVAQAARSAERAAKLAREILDKRNHAYTFHADPAFSFGEGWYVAAAGVLCGVEIQVEEGKAQTEQARRFLADVGLPTRPYRSRPRANKALPALIADAFARDASRAQRKLRGAFLGSAGVAPSVAHWADERLRALAPAQKKVLVWVRDVAAHDVHRNSPVDEVHTLCELAGEEGLYPVLFGDRLSDAPTDAIDLTWCWKLPLFQSLRMRRAQLELFEYLSSAHRLVGQIGVTSAGMDGPALLGLETTYLSDAPNSRLGRWVGAVPGYRELVRHDGYWDEVRARFRGWAKG